MTGILHLYYYDSEKYRKLQLCWCKAQQKVVNLVKSRDIKKLLKLISAFIIYKLFTITIKLNLHENAYSVRVLGC